MDYSAFCREIYNLLSPRLPLRLQSESDSASLLRQGGWYYPSLRDKDAWFFDLQKAYSYFLSGTDCRVIADAMESAFLMHQWKKTEPFLNAPLSSSSSLRWSLRIRPVREAAFLPDNAHFLYWDKYILEACCRTEDSFEMHTLLSVEKDSRQQEGVYFWPLFWSELIRQDPPVLFSNHPHQIHKEINLTANPLGRMDYPKENSYILTSRRRQFGAAVLFYPGLLERIAAFLSGFLILLSSPHELILFPGKGMMMRDILEYALDEARAESPEEEKRFTPGLYQYTVGKGLFSF